MVRAVLTGRLTGLGFDLAWFSSLSSKHLFVFDLRGAIYIYIFNFFVQLFMLPFNEVRLVGLALVVVD